MIDPVKVEFYTAEYKKLISEINHAADLLIPDAYQEEKDLLLSCSSLLESKLDLFDMILNLCSQGVIFNEASIIHRSVEQNTNQSVLGILWSCQDIISSIYLFDADFEEYRESLTINDPLYWKVDQLIDIQKLFDSFIADLDLVSKNILECISRLDDLS